MELTHTDENGKASMVDVGEKDITERTAVAMAVISMKKETMTKIKENGMKKGDVLAVARVAGIMGGKKTSELIPLCHNIPIDKIALDFEFVSDTELKIIATAKCSYKTGIEMEALTSAAVSALTVYDMCKGIDRSMTIEKVCLLHKDGGKSGVFDREA